MVECQARVDVRDGRVGFDVADIKACFVSSCQCMREEQQGMGDTWQRTQVKPNANNNAFDEER
jgi:hypothetical protein